MYTYIYIGIIPKPLLEEIHVVYLHAIQQWHKEQLKSLLFNGLDKIVSRRKNEKVCEGCAYLILVMYQLANEIIFRIIPNMLLAIFLVEKMDNQE